MSNILQFNKYGIMIGDTVRIIDYESPYYNIQAKVIGRERNIFMVAIPQYINPILKFLFGTPNVWISLTKSQIKKE